MDSVRYFFAVLVVIAVPPAVLMWYIVHPFVKQWRKVGARAALTINIGLIFVGMWLLYLVRWALVGQDLGTQPVLIVAAVVLMVPTIMIALKRKKHLTMRILAGVPELQADGKGGTLLQEGIYGTIRHPRYVEVALGTIAYALFANYSGVYVVTVAAIIALHGIVVLEERELIERFGDEYRAYRERVPRYIPRRR